jgi:redox-sensitive bicupin YhaK (pirin superfamily)
LQSKAYLLVAEGEVSVNDILAQTGDEVTISKQAPVILTEKTDSELLIIEVPGLEEAR